MAAITSRSASWFGTFCKSGPLRLLLGAGVFLMSLGPQKRVRAQESPIQVAGLEHLDPKFVSIFPILADDYIQREIKQNQMDDDRRRFERQQQQWRDEDFRRNQQLLQPKPGSSSSSAGATSEAGFWTKTGFVVGGVGLGTICLGSVVLLASGPDGNQTPGLVTLGIGAAAMVVGLIVAAVSTN